MGRAAAAEGHGALNALEMDYSSCGFGCALRRPAKMNKGAKKAAYYPKARYSPKNSAWRLASPLFPPAASVYQDALAVAQQGKAESACAEADAARPV